MAPMGDKDWWVAVGERLGVPSLLLVMILVGLYSIVTPLTNRAVSFMSQQTEVLRQMSYDVRQTRIIVEKDAAERKAELIEEIRDLIQAQHDDVEGKLETIRSLLQRR